MSEGPQNVVQATGAMASSVIEGLRNQPALLFLLVLNMIVFGLTAWAGSVRAQRDTLILERCLPKVSDTGAVTTGGTDVSRP